MPAGPDASLHALLNKLVDYAGFFPPADLSLEQALRNYKAYGQSEDAWMLNRFVCKASQLSEVKAMSTLFEEASTFRLSVLAGRGDMPPTFLKELEHDIAHAEQFHAQIEDAARVEAIEMLLPTALLTADTAGLNGFLHDVQDLARNAQLPMPSFFLEIPLDEHTTRHATLVAGAVSTSDLEAPFGLKLRCGGAMPSDHPAPKHLASAVSTCLQQNVPFKATAGLHHPFRHHNEEVGAHMHGFLNLFGGAAVAIEKGLSTEDFQRILEDEAPEHFDIRGDEMSWQEHTVTADAIRRARQLALSFGSCSFDEPREDLRAHNLL